MRMSLCVVFTRRCVGCLSGSVTVVRMKVFHEQVKPLLWKDVRVEHGRGWMGVVEGLVPQSQYSEHHGLTFDSDANVLRDCAAVEGLGRGSMLSVCSSCSVGCGNRLRMSDMRKRQRGEYTAVEADEHKQGVNLSAIPPELIPSRIIMGFISVRVQVDAGRSCRNVRGPLTDAGFTKVADVVFGQSLSLRT
jgi:hypothetical protein